MLEHKLIEKLLAGCRYVIQVMNYVLDRSDFKEQIKAIQSMIRPEQYGQSNQSDTINNTTRAMQSKRYDQQYNQDKPRGGNDYIVSSI